MLHIETKPEVEPTTTFCSKMRTKLQNLKLQDDRTYLLIIERKISPSIGDIQNFVIYIVWLNTAWRFALWKN